MLAGQTVDGGHRAQAGWTSNGVQELGRQSGPVTTGTRECRLELELMDKVHTSGVDRLESTSE